MRKSSTRSVPWGRMQEGPAKNTQPLSPWARFPYLSILELTEKEGASGMTPIQEVRCHKQVPPGLAALTSTRPCVQRVRTPQSQDSDGRPCQEEWSQPGSFLGPRACRGGLSPGMARRTCHRANIGAPCPLRACGVPVSQVCPEAVGSWGGGRPGELCSTGSRRRVAGDTQAPGAAGSPRCSVAVAFSLFAVVVNSLIEM